MIPARGACRTARPREECYSRTSRFPLPHPRRHRAPKGLFLLGYVARVWLAVRNAPRLLLHSAQEGHKHHISLSLDGYLLQLLSWGYPAQQQRHPLAQCQAYGDDHPGHGGGGEGHEYVHSAEPIRRPPANIAPRKPTAVPRTRVGKLSAW